jgi:hypothetical protein
MRSVATRAAVGSGDSPGSQPYRHGRRGRLNATAPPCAIVRRRPLTAVSVWPLAAPIPVSVAVTGPAEMDTETGASAATAAADRAASTWPTLRRYICRVSAEGKNFEAIVKAKADHNKNCPFPPHTVRMNPFEIERMQWEEGDTIAGLVLEADPQLGTGAFRLVCDGMEPPELETEDLQVIEAPAAPLEVPVGPSREGDPRF